jgi:hypothetical protein
LEGETLPISNVLFPVVFENEASTPLHNPIEYHRRIPEWGIVGE